MRKNIKRIDYSRNFLKQLKKSPLEIKIAFKKRLELFLKEPFHPQLNNHPLTGKYSNYRSINITGDGRAIFSEFEDASGKAVIFETSRNT
jgi:mRNA-degrading endonuclease YafQ of YafQ-DinJ toxin-antitoxin module